MVQHSECVPKHAHAAVLSAAAGSTRDQVQPTPLRYRSTLPHMVLSTKRSVIGSGALQEILAIPRSDPPFTTNQRC